MGMSVLIKNKKQLMQSKKWLENFSLWKRELKKEKVKDNPFKNIQIAAVTSVIDEIKGQIKLYEDKESEHEKSVKKN